MSRRYKKSQDKFKTNNSIDFSKILHQSSTAQVDASFHCFSTIPILMRSKPTSTAPVERGGPKWMVTRK